MVFYDIFIYILEAFVSQNIKIIQILEDVMLIREIYVPKIVKPLPDKWSQGHSNLISSSPCPDGLFIT